MFVRGGAQGFNWGIFLERKTPSTHQVVKEMSCETPWSAISGAGLVMFTFTEYSQVFYFNTTRNTSRGKAGTFRRMWCGMIPGSLILEQGKFSPKKKKKKVQVSRSWEQAKDLLQSWRTLLICSDFLDVCSESSCVLSDPRVWYTAWVGDRSALPLLPTTTVALLTLAFPKEWLAAGKILFLLFLAQLWNKMETLFYSVDSPT